MQLLLGWSLGDLLSIAIARILPEHDSSGISIDGLLLIDTPFHIPWYQYPFEPSNLIDPAFRI
jgi:pimeloyl-ACP methyl ester carboxylesterase